MTAPGQSNEVVGVPWLEHMARLYQGMYEGCSDPRDREKFRNYASAYNTAVTHFKNRVVPDQALASLRTCDHERTELIDGVAQAISIVGTIIDEHFDEDPPEMSNGSPEREALQTLRGHLEGTLIDNKTGEYFQKDRFATLLK